MTKVLVTGGSGFIAAHIVEQLLDQGHEVVTTVRSEEKADKIRKGLKNKGDKLEIAIVPDIAKPDAFDEVVKIPELDAVLHTASPFHFNFKDPKTELIDPAVVGTTGILKALHRSTPSVKRVVVTSSFAAILSEAGLTDPNTTFTEKSWNPSTIDDIHSSPATAYRVSKTLAEKAAWDFVEQEKPGFDLVTVNPPLVVGPVAPYLANLESINTSNGRFVNLLKGEWKEKIPEVAPVALWVDVRDVAKAHIRALELPEAGGKRLFTTPGYYTHREVVEIVRREFPEFKDKLPGPEVEGGDLPPKDKSFKINNNATNKLLNFEWISLEKSIIDLVETLKELGVEKA